jgi:CHAT domain-containing protein
MGLNADLAILSACDTARGSFGWGEGVIGLSWSLFAAGASTSVVSQWQVDSASTTSLMIAFHEQLRKPGAGQRMSSAAALRNAAMQLMAQPGSRHPFYWAGFIAIGAK